MVVLSYHSLEDRITKQALATRARSSAPIGLPVEPPGTGPTLRLLTRGAEQPDPAQVAANPRAASARLRAAEHITGKDQTGKEQVARQSRRIRGLRQPGALRAASPAVASEDVTEQRGRGGTELQGEGI
jgi:16S rRNA (cytosine1402-N4)-methyltransferase